MDATAFLKEVSQFFSANKKARHETGYIFSKAVPFLILYTAFSKEICSGNDESLDNPIA
ncbi:hypothetical protein [Succinivibrio dextrinosolvens]|uniref:hypothetical protein n=1 Tax=Succinivibrio dextrinosolvens TaxID=83771 RepID=UPI0013E92CB6|nr:hypothetical protein [Succinivibrio dextrinosolvens]